MNKKTSNMIYISAPGAGLGFKMSGIDIMELENENNLIAQLKTLKENGNYQIIFIDESLASENLEDIERFNEETLPAIVLLPNPANPQNLASEKMKNLVTQAVGSDILNN